MLARLTASFPYLLLAGLAALTFWLDQAVQPQGAQPDARARHDPDYIVDHLAAVRTNETGRVVYTLSAERMVHYPDDDTTELAQPRFVSSRSPQAPVTVTARNAKVSNDGDNVYFHDDVKVTRAPYAGRSELVLRTSYLHVMPDSDIAQTDRPVTISDAAMTVDAIGFELNSETRVLKLKSNVRGTYDATLDTARERRR